jgi:hypothetical protein
MFQYVFKAINLVVIGIEEQAKAAVTKGQPGYLLADINNVAEALRLSQMGLEVLATLIQQSDVLRVSEDQKWLIPCEPPKDVIDVLVAS